jgi:DNA replication protein DnaC
MELNHQLTPQLKQRRLSGVLATLDARHRQASDGQWADGEFLERWLEDEIERRAQKQLAWRVRRATLNTTKTLEGFDGHFNPTINRQQVLHLASCEDHPSETPCVALWTHGSWQKPPRASPRP